MTVDADTGDGPDAAAAESGRVLRGARDGDRTCWDELVARHTSLLWAVARSFRLDTADAGDVVASTWLRLVENLTSIREPDRIGAWLATTARRESLKVLRHSGRQVPVDDADLDRADTSSEPLDAGLLRDERDAAVWAGLAALSPRCQGLLRVLAADPAPSYAEVGAALGMPVGSIGPTRGRCLARLRQVMTAGVGDEAAGDGAVGDEAAGDGATSRITGQPRHSVQYERGGRGGQQ